MLGRRVGSRDSCTRDSLCPAAARHAYWPARPGSFKFDEFFCAKFWQWHGEAAMADASTDDRRLYVVHSKFVPEQMLRTFFDSYGEVAEMKLLRDAGGNSRGCAFVTYATAE